MRVYSDILSAHDVEYTASVHDVLVDVDDIQRPRVRRRGWRIQTFGTTGRYKNSGRLGAAHDHSASWDQHGRWMAELFRRDPNALIIGAARYDGVADFHDKTKGKYS